MKDGQTGKSRGFGFITYSHSTMVDEAMHNRPRSIDGRQVQPKRAVPRDSNHPGSNMSVNRFSSVASVISQSKRRTLTPISGLLVRSRN